mgnify:CR=1 FL=1
MDGQENKNTQNPNNEENPLKKAAMATIGALSSAVEKVADAISAKPAADRTPISDTFKVIKEKSGDVFTQVKDFSVNTYEKVKDAVDDPEVKQFTTTEEAKSALHSALNGLRATAEKGAHTLSDAAAMGKEEFHELAGNLSQELKAGKDRFDKLLHRVRTLEAEAEAKAKREAAADNDEDGEMGDGNIVYDSDAAPKAEADKVEQSPVDEQKASPTAPTDENNTNKLQTENMNEHLRQQVPPEY